MQVTMPPQKSKCGSSSNKRLMRDIIMNKPYVKKILAVIVFLLFMGMNVVSSTGNIGKASSIYKSNNPPYEPSNPHPPDGGTNVPIDVTLCWTGGDPDPGDSVTYDVYLGGSYPPHNLVSNNQSETWYEPTELELNKTYFWRIVSWDSQGLSTSGPYWTFTTGTNHPPSAPMINGPSSKPVLKNLLGVKPLPIPLPKPGTYNFTFKAIDSDDHDLYYYIKWGDGDTSGWIGPYPSDEEVKVSHTWNSQGTYQVRAKAKDIYGAEGPWGELSIPIERNKIINNLFLRLLEYFPKLLPIPQQLLVM